MKPSKTVSWLAGLVAVLALIAASAGLFWPAAGAPYTFTAQHGDVVDIYGQGLYAGDSVMKSGATRGTDVVVLVLATPLLVVALARYRRGSTRGALLLAGALTFFLYVYATNAMSVVYNGLFLLYVALFSLSFHAWCLMMTAIQPIVARFPASLPYRGMATFLLLCGLLTGFIWLEPIVGASLRGTQPDLLDHYTTLVTEALDLALIVPGCFLAGVMLWRRDPRGVGVAVPLLVLLLLVGPAVAAMTWFQVADGIVFTIPQIVGPIGGFLVLGVIDIWVLAIVLRAAPGAVASDK
jgi:hypothetical protein